MKYCCKSLQLHRRFNQLLPPTPIRLTYSFIFPIFKLVELSMLQLNLADLKTRNH